jgi:hypothetical protein
MVKPLFTLASHVLTTNGSFVSNLKRIQHGFLAREQLVLARRYVRTLQDMLDELEDNLSPLASPSTQTHNQSPLTLAHVSSQSPP